MSQILNIAVLPLDIAWADRDENLIVLNDKVASIDRSVDLIVIPELFSTGYIEDRNAIETAAESTSGETIRTVTELSRRLNVAICGSFLYVSGCNFYNRAFFIEPNGDETFYDKRHLFSLSEEHNIFTAGTSLPPVVRYRGWNIAMIICYDLRFPVWCRNTSHRYDLMLVPANWPESRSYAWRHLIIARAIENQSVYVGANRSGRDDYGDYGDTSIIVDSLGKEVSERSSTGILYASIDKEILQEQRRKLPFGADADDFICHI